MEEYFVCGIIDLSKKEIISGNIKRRVGDFEIQLDSFRDELDWWFTLLANTSYPASIRLRKPIVIELFEFSDYMIRVMNQINEAVRIIGGIYKATDRKQPMEYLEKSTQLTIKKWKKYLHPFRNQIAAHRYITKDGKFLKLGDIIRFFRQISDKKLSEAKTELFDCHNKIRSWLATPANRNHLVLARKERD